MFLDYSRFYIYDHYLECVQVVIRVDSIFLRRREIEATQVGKPLLEHQGGRRDKRINLNKRPIKEH